jgi:hypothetical protein
MLTNDKAQEQHNCRRGVVTSVVSEDEAVGYEAHAVVWLLRVVGGLQELGDLRVQLQMKLTKAAVPEVFGAVQELLPCWIAHDYVVEAGLLSIDSGGSWALPH